MVWYFACVTLPEKLHAPVVEENDAVIPLAVVQPSTSKPLSKFALMVTEPLARFVVSASVTIIVMVTAVAAEFSVNAKASDSSELITGASFTAVTRSDREASALVRDVSDIRIETVRANTLGFEEVVA